MTMIVEFVDEDATRRTVREQGKRMTGGGLGGDDDAVSVRPIVSMNGNDYNPCG